MSALQTRTLVQQCTCASTVMNVHRTGDSRILRARFRVCIAHTLRGMTSNADERSQDEGTRHA